MYFDLDGTLIDSDTALPRVWEQTLQRYGLDLPILKIRGATKGVPANVAFDAFPELSALVDRQDFLYGLERLEERYNYDLLTGAREFVVRCSELGKKNYIVTSSWKEKIDKILLDHDMTGMFDGAISRESTTKHKPAPDPYFAAMELSGQKAPEEVVVFEDSESGVRAAKAAGLFCVMIGSPANGQFTGADIVVKDFSRIVL